MIARAVGGDDQAQRALYDAHVDRVYRLAYRMSGDEDLAQDFTQDTFIRAFARLKEFRGDSAFSTWLHTVAVSVILNGLRKVKRLRERETDLDDAAGVGVVPGAAEPDLKDRLRRAVDGLAEHHRLVFVMHDVEGFTHEEIGQVLDIPEGTSKARLFRARAALREKLADFAGEWAT
ncbi:MAG: sigma-70 family RNA polymerase sigma factor [Gemmatimonadetes bacterium]|nr:sigma-70 family RNA polymerase sigma factor [Gemmatimonadota bacterium]